MSKTYVGIKLQDLGLYNTLDPKDKIVIVKDKDEGVLQLKDFFLYVQSNLDLSNYYTSTQADTIFMAKVDAYTRKDADVKFALVEKTYTRTQSDSRFALASDTFNKTEIEEKYASKEQMYTKDLVYTKDEAITAFALKTEIPILPDLTPYSTTAKGDLRWALKVDVFSKTEADARFANINNYYTKSESDNKYALLTDTYTKAETDNKFLDTTEAYTKDYINLNIYTKTQVYTKAETDGKYPLKTDVYTVTAVNDQFAAKSWVYSRAEADNTFRKLADSYNKTEVNALIDASKSGLSTDVSNTYYTKTDADNKFELKGTAYNKIDSDAKYALISNSISPSQVAAKYYNKTEIDKSLGDAATNTSNLFALKTAAVGGISLTPTNLTFTKVDGTSSLVAIPTWNQSTTGNAATATTLQTTRAISLTGAVTAAGVNFDGSANISINATSLDATKLAGIVPDASLAGTYSNVSLDISKNIIYTLNNTNSTENSGTVFGLGSIRAYGAPAGSVIVIKTSIPSAAGNVVSLQLKGLSDSETSTIDMVLSGYTLGSISKLSLGTKDYDVRKARSSDGFLCFLISHPSGNLGISTALSVVYAHVNYLVNVNYYRNWSIYYTTDLTTFTNISDYCPQKTSVVNTYWTNVQGKPTTVSGYGITDAYTKTDVYTKTESDNRFSFKQESIKSATLNTSTLSFTKADNTVSNISIPTWNQDTSGNSATATKLQTPRTINGVSFDGSSNITTPAYSHLYSVNNRTIKPSQLVSSAITSAFSTKLGMDTGTEDNSYVDFLGFNSWENGTGGSVNALVFTKKGPPALYHYSGAVGANNWNWSKQIAYTDSNITGNAASASKWQTVRTFNITGDATWSASVDGTSDVTGALTLANTGVNAGTYTKITVDSKGRATSGSNLVPADIPSLDMTKVNTGVLGINQGGTGGTTAATAITNLGLGTSAVLDVGEVNGVASLDASGKVPTSQLYINNTLTSTDTTVPLTAAQGKVLNDSLGVTNANLQTLTNRLDNNYYLKSDVFTKAEITNNYFDKTYVNNSFLAQAANKDVSIAGFINAGKDILFNTSLTGIKWSMNSDGASIFFKNISDSDTDSYLGFEVGDNGDEYFRWSFNAPTSNKIAMSLRRDRLEINNSVATLGLSTSATLTDISKIPQYGIYSKGNIKTDGQIITNATSYHENISDLGVGADSPIKIPNYEIPLGKTGYIPFLHGSVLTAGNGYTMHSSLGLYRANNTWWDGGMYMAIGGDDRNPTVAFRFKLDGTIDFTGGSVNLVGNTSSATKLQTARTISLTGDGSWSTTFDGTGNSTGTFTLANTGIPAGNYTKVNVDTKGRVVGGSNITPTDIPNLDTSKITTGLLPIARGGTGASDAASARNNLGLGSAAIKNTGTNDGEIMTVGSFGIGTGTKSSADVTSATTLVSSTGGKTGVYRSESTGIAGYQSVPVLYMHSGDTHTTFSAQQAFEGVKVVSWSDDTVNTPLVRTLYHDKSTVIYNSTVSDTANVFVTADGQLKRALNPTVDATKLTGIVPDANISGTYRNLSLDISNNTVYSIKQPGVNNSTTVYGLGSIRAVGTAQNAVIVIKTRIPKTSSNVINLHLKGVSDSETSVIDITISGWVKGNLNKLSLGTKDYTIRKAETSDGYVCFIISYSSGYLGTSTAFSIVTAHLNFGVDPSTFNNWSIYETTDLSGITNISQPFSSSTSKVNTLWDNIQNKPTTVAGYGITDAYTKTDVYTRTETDGKYPVKVDSTKAITLTPSNMALTKADNSVVNVTIPTWNQSTTGNAATATTLQSARTINGVAFDGSSNITITDNTKLPTTGGSLTNNIVFTNTNTGINWDMNADNAGIYFKNDSDADTDSYLMFSVGDNGNEYFRWGNSQDTNLMSLKSGALNVRDSVTTNTVYARNISLTNDLVASNNITSKNLYGNLLLNNSDSVIRDIGTGPSSVYYGVVNSRFSGDAEGYIVIQTNLLESRNGMYGINIDIYQSYGGWGGKIYIQFYRYGGWYGANYNIEGNMDVPVRLGILDGKIAIILGSARWESSHVAVTKVLASFFYSDDDLRGWTVSRVTDISAYTGVAVINEATSSIKTNWNKMVNKPTTIGGYGITDAYTKTEADTRYTIVDSPVIYTSVPSRVQYNRPMVLDCFGLQSNRNIWITANNDNNNIPEPVIITSGKGHYPSADMGLSVYPDVVNFFGGNNWWNSSGNVKVSGTVTAGSSITSSSATCAWLINTNADYHSDSLHKFRTMNGTPQKVAASGLLVSDSFGDIGSVPANGIWAKGDVKTGSSLSAATNVFVGNNVQFSTTGAGIRWDMNTDFGRIYFKNDSNGDANSYLAFEVGDDNTEHFKWFVSTAEVMTLRNTGLSVNTIGIKGTTASSGDGISLHAGAVSGQPSYGLFFGGTGTFGTHGDTSADWATYFTMTGGSNRGWVFRSLDNGNVASISARGHGWFNYIQSTSDIYAAGVLNTGSYIYASGYVNTSSVYNRTAGYYSDSRHSFLTNGGNAQGINAGSILASDNYSDSNKVPAYGIWAKGDIKTNTWLYAGGEVRAGTNIQAGGNVTAGGSITAQGDVTAFSDKRLKDNIEIVDNALEKVKQLNGVTYTRNDLEDKEQRYIGLLAQDVTEVFPEAVKENEGGILSLNYSGLIGGLVEAIKELDNKNQALEARLAKLEELINGITK